MSDAYIWGVIGGMAVLNLAVRFPPIAIVSRVALPRPVMRWLSFIPISVMGALVALEVFRPGGEAIAGLSSPYPWGALASAVVYWKTRSFLGATLAGVLAFVVLRGLVG